MERKEWRCSSCCPAMLLVLSNIGLSGAFLFHPTGRSRLSPQPTCRYGIDGQDWYTHGSNCARHRTITGIDRLRASAAASPANEHHPQQQHPMTSRSMLDTAISLPPVSHGNQDGSGSSSKKVSVAVASPHAQRETDGVTGKGVGGHGRRSESNRGLFRGAPSKVLSYLTIMTTGILFRFLLTGLNKVECHNRQALLDAVLDRGDRGLLTDGTEKMRWALCTDDIYYAHPILTNILIAGRTLPIKRTRGMEQPLFKAFFEKLEQGEWGHIFAEGGIRQPWRFSRNEPILADFKAGIGRLLLRSEIASEAPIHKRGRGKLVKIIPNIGRTVRVYVGEPIDVAPILNKCRAKIGDMRSLPWTKRSSMEEVACHREIAAYEHVLKLEAVARRDFYGDDPASSPYSTAPE